MEVREAVQRAKSYIVELFGDEGIANVGLEEVEMDQENCWKITIGFVRTWDSRIDSILGADNDRLFKIVKIRNKDNRILSVTDRKLEKTI